MSRVSRNVGAWRKRQKTRAIAYKGGECSRCGYKTCHAALEFHHVGKKSFGISTGETRGWTKVKIELGKCILLCANCHREIHNKPSVG